MFTSPKRMKTEQSLFQRIIEGIHDMCYIWWMEMKNTIKDEGVLIFCVLVPLGYPLIYSWIYNNEVVRDVPVAVVDMSHSEASREFARRFDASPSTKVAYYCDNLNDAKTLIGQQKAYGILYFPESFQRDLGRSEQAHVGVYCEMSFMLTYKAIFQTATSVAADMNTAIQLPQSGGFTNRDDEINAKPLDFDEIAMFNSPLGYGNALLPAVLILILQQTLLLGIGLSAGTARENNRFKDLVPMSRHFNGIFRIVLGKSMCYFMIYCVMGAYITLAVPRMFRFTAIAQPAHLALFMIPFILSVIFFGMFLSCMVRYRENVILLVVFTSVPFLFMSGVSWPQSNIPGIWEGFASLIPSTFGVRGFLKLSSMGADLHDVETEYQALWIQVLVYFFATCMVYRYQILSARKHAIERMERIKSSLINQPDVKETQQ